MEATEFRIGNKVQEGIIASISQDFADEPYFVEVRDEGGMCEEFNVTEINPIPLTEEMLIKSGFKKDTHAIFLYLEKPINNWLLIYANYPGGLGFKLEADGRYEWPGEMDLLEKVKYVHQLQNLYFSLTGEELVIK